MTPNGWRALRLGDAVSFEYGKSLPSAQRRGGPVPVCGSNGVVGYHDESLVRGPGIVVGRKGSVGAVAWMGCDFWPIDTTYYVNPSSQTDARWLYYAMSNLGLERLNQATGIPGLNRSTAASLHFQLPPIVEQRKIAAILSSVDDAIEKTQAVIGQVQVVKRGLMQELLTKGLRGRHERFKKTDIGEIPEEWDLQPAAAICKRIVVGIVVRPAQHYAASGVPCLRSLNVREDRIVGDEMKYISHDSNRQLRKSQLKSGDVVTVRTGYPGTSAVVPERLGGANCVDLIITTPGPRVRGAFSVEVHQLRPGACRSCESEGRACAATFQRRSHEGDAHSCAEPK